MFIWRPPEWSAPALGASTCPVCREPVGSPYFVHPGRCFETWRASPGLGVSLHRGGVGGYGDCAICGRWVEPPRCVHEGACESKWNAAQAAQVAVFWPGVVATAVIITSIVVLAIFINWT
jgi:hypothetical protein